MSRRVSLRFSSVWGEAYELQEDNGLGFPHPQDNVWPYLGGYIALRKSFVPSRLLMRFSDVPCTEVLTAIITILSQLPSIWGSLRASRELYHTMLLSVIRYESGTLKHFKLLTSNFRQSSQSLV